jgi:DNA-binding CsgD family transcriptional regulator
LIQAERTQAEVAPDRAYRLMCAAERDRPAGTADWQPAAALWREIGWPWPLAYTLLRQAEQDGTAEHLREAWVIAARLGARPLLETAERLAAQLGVDLGGGADGSSAPAKATTNPLDALNLTAREQEVLLLVAAGRSNPEIAKELFISPKTASVHVSNILAKLGLSSRVAAATLVHRLGLGS